MLLGKLWDKIDAGMRKNILASTCFLSPRELELSRFLFGAPEGLYEFGGYGDAERKMLVGLAHDRIVHLGMAYVDRGYVTQDEYENLNDYLYAPYEKMGGNGSAKRVMEEVRKLPMKKM